MDCLETKEAAKQVIWAWGIGTVYFKDGDCLGRKKEINATTGDNSPANSNHSSGHCKKESGSPVALVIKESWDIASPAENSII